MTHVWQCYNTRYALKSPPAPPWNAALSWLILLSLTTEAQQRSTRSFHGSGSVTAQLMICLQCWVYTISEKSLSWLSCAQRGCVHMLQSYDQQPVIYLLFGSPVMLHTWTCATYMHTEYLYAEQTNNDLILIMTMMHQLCMMLFGQYLACDVKCNIKEMSLSFSCQITV